MTKNCINAKQAGRLILSAVFTDKLLKLRMVLLNVTTLFISLLLPVLPNFPLPWHTG